MSIMYPVVVAVEPQYSEAGHIHDGAEANALVLDLVAGVVDILSCRCTAKSRRHRAPGNIDEDLGHIASAAAGHAAVAG